MLVIGYKRTVQRGINLGGLMHSIAITDNNTVLHASKVLRDYILNVLTKKKKKRRIIM